MSDELITVYNAQTKSDEQVALVDKTKVEWKEILTPESFHVLREKGTERAFTGDYHDYKGRGIYKCKACGVDLYHSDDKFDSGTGWPSYTRAVDERNIKEAEDNTLFMKRTELLCARCNSHLGHVFDDGPAPTNKRHCINSLALNFVGQS